MERQIVTRRRLLGVGAATLAGATFATSAPMRALAGVPDAQATNIASFQDAVAKGLDNTNLGDINNPQPGTAAFTIAKHVRANAVDHQFYGLPWLAIGSFDSHGVFSAPARQAIFLLLQLLRGAFPDFQTTLVDVAASGDRVFGRASSRGTFTGTHLVDNSGTPIQPTGLPFAIEIHDEFRFETLTTAQLAMGQVPMVVEHWGVSDNLALLLQLGGLSFQSGAVFQASTLPSI